MCARAPRTQEGSPHRNLAPSATALVSSTDMTILELTRLMSAQDDRWGRILTRAQSAKNPAARPGVDFFQKTWRPFMGSYFESVAARYDSAAEAPARVVRWVLDTMAGVIFPAARAVGFSERSFVIPDITIESTEAQRPTIATSGAEAPRDAEVGVGTKIAFAALALAGVGAAVYVRDLRRIARAAA